MASNAQNFDYFTYTSDDGNQYTLRADDDWGNAAVSALGAMAGHPLYGRSTRRRRPRRFLFQDPVTFRTFSGPVGTAAGFAAGVIGTTVYAVSVAGLAGTVNYTLRKKIAEAVPGYGAPRQAGQNP